ncbi:MAG: hypothetical protein JOZ42_17015 [Acetobacteraceae bacterium]|nr:hypothetical protein [Acetobacteraceae bacterium]
MSHRLLVLLALACVGAGCNRFNDSVQGALDTRDPQLPKDQLDQIDGIYKGSATTVEAHSAICPTERFGTVEIGDRTLNFALTPTTIFITPIQADGSVHTTTQDSSLDGKLTDGRLVFTVRNALCETRYDLRWVL